MGRPDGKITFGTDGWRDVIADNFTFANVRLAAQAVADYLLKQQSRPRVVVGHDTRFLSRDFAVAAAQVLAAGGLEVLLTENFTPTPAVSMAVKANKAQAGIVITASHNPAKYNGFKVKAAYGGSADQEIMAAVEAEYLANLAAGKEPPAVEVPVSVGAGVKLFDPEPVYLQKINGLLDKEIFSGRKPRIVIDPLYGAGQGWMRRLLTGLDCRAEEIHNRVLPTFGGLNPEPIAPNLGALKKTVVNKGFDLGLALDGDADRIGAVDERGNFVNSHQIFALVLKHLVERRGWRGKVVKTVSTTQMIDRLARKYGLPLEETPIGFKYICRRILDDDVLIGGEESGGISIKGHIPERDGLLMGALIVEVMLAAGKPLSALVANLFSEVGPAYYDRLDKEVLPAEKERFLTWIKSQKIEEINKRPVISRNFRDGFKFFFQDEQWLLLRPSGTEPVIRLYAEAADRSEVKALLNDAAALLERAGKEG